MAIYRVGYQAGMKSKKEKPKSKYDFFKENKMNKTKLKQLVKETLAETLEDDEAGRNPGGSIGEAHDKEWAAMSSDEQSRVDALTSIEHEADGLEKGANVMIKGHEMGRQLDNKAIGKVILSMAKKIRDHVKRHREEMSQPGW